MLAIVGHGATGVLGVERRDGEAGGDRNPTEEDISGNAGVEAEPAKNAPTFCAARLLRVGESPPLPIIEGIERERANDAGTVRWDGGLRTGVTTPHGAKGPVVPS